MNTPDSLIFRYVASVLFFLIQGFALYLLLRGHNLPGGGFIGGLVASIALLLLTLAIGIREMKKVLRVDPVVVAVWGVILAAGTGIIPMLVGKPYLEQFNYHFYDVPFVGELHVGTPLIFDIGVYLLVIGIVVKLMFSLSESTDGEYHLEESNRIYSSPLEEPIEDAGEGAGLGGDEERRDGDAN